MPNFPLTGDFPEKAKVSENPKAVLSQSILNVADKDDLPGVQVALAPVIIDQSPIQFQIPKIDSREQSSVI